jgi:hypothetical protein
MVSYRLVYGLQSCKGCPVMLGSRAGRLGELLPLPYSILICFKYGNCVLDF